MQLESFRALLENQVTLLEDSEIEEFFREISLKLNDTNIFNTLSEDEILERITEMLVYIPADSIIGLRSAKLVELIKCDSLVFEKKCHNYSHDLVDTNEYYSIKEDLPDDELLDEREIQEQIGVENSSTYEYYGDSEYVEDCYDDENYDD